MLRAAQICLATISASQVSLGVANRFRVDIPRLIEHYIKGRLHLDDWISARIKLSEINDGFANMKSGKALRSVVMVDA
jgi:S-(hydroxymethyl)glutathione dehydrogenase / alcohol dehydrogenase